MEILRALLIHLAVPLAGLWVFLWLRDNMLDAEIESPPTLPLLIIFATYGGWLMVVLTLLFWYWSGAALLGSIYLIFVAPFVMIVLAVWLYPRRKLSPYHNGSFWASAAYTVIPVGVVMSRAI